ncbi:MAG: hotdog fold thioesterase [Actinomycetes bacterium]
MSDNAETAASPQTGTAGWLTVNDLNANLGALAGTLGVRFTEASLERCVATMPVEGNTQPYGLLHGGASVALAETVGSMAAVLAAGSGRAALGLDISATHHRAVRTGTVTATATPLSVGRTVGSFDISVRDEQGRRVCTARLTCQLRDQPPSGGGVRPAG